MSSRACGAATNWARQMMLEVVFEDYRAVMSLDADTESVIDGVKSFLPLHLVTDCSSLHETVIKSSLPEDKRCALEVLALREMLINEHYESEDDVESETQRLREKELKEFFRWAVSEDQKADLLTKVATRDDRSLWHLFANWISIRSAKASDEKAAKMIPSITRPKLDKGKAEILIRAHADAARSAGFQ
jgi:hypothetical protein